MKTSIFAVAFLLTFSLCSHKRDIIQDKELFQHKTINGYSNYIELQRNTDSIKGVNIGVKLNLEGVPVFYKSSFVYSNANNLEKKKDEREISFILKKFDFSFKPFSFIYDNTDLITDTSKVPFMLLYPIVFLGKRSGDSLQLKRIDNISDSRVDEMIFGKLPQNFKRIP